VLADYREINRIKAVQSKLDLVLQRSTADSRTHSESDQSVAGLLAVDSLHSNRLSGTSEPPRPGRLRGSSGDQHCGRSFLAPTRNRNGRSPSRSPSFLQEQLQDQLPEQFQQQTIFALGFGERHQGQNGSIGQLLWSRRPIDPSTFSLRMGLNGGCP
jgi:hypothetical protein